jgi:hypothetical protein
MAAKKAWIKLFFQFFDFTVVINDLIFGMYIDNPVNDFAVKYIIKPDDFAVGSFLYGKTPVLLLADIMENPVHGAGKTLWRYGL